MDTMLQKLPPGPRFLARRIHYISTPPICVFLATTLARTLGGVQLPTLAVVLVYILSFPLFLLGYRSWKNISTKRAAAAHGAVMAPMAKSRGIPMKGEQGYPRMSLAFLSSCTETLPLGD